jgi:hypothetical protein
MLATLRKLRDDLENKINAKIAELKDDTPESEAKRIEGEHDALVRELAKCKADIAAAEREEAERTAPAPAREPAPAASETPDRAAIVAETTRVERLRVAEIGKLAARFGELEMGNKAIADGMTLDAFRNALIDKLAASPANTVGPASNASRLEVRNESDEARGLAMEIALLHRWDPKRFDDDFKKTPQATEYRGMSLVEIGRECLELHGTRTRGFSKMEIAGHALSMRSTMMPEKLVMRAGGMMSSSDFPNVLANVAYKTLRQGYEQAPQTFRPLVRETTVPDFKTVSRVQLGEAPKLERVNEHGEFRRGKMGDAAERYAVATYGKIIALTRQVIINDDLNAFTRIPRAFGMQAANLESDLVWSQILANANMGDGRPLFSATYHNNVATGGGLAAPSAVTISAGRLGMAKQTGLDGQTLLNLDPVYIIVPKALQTAVEQLRGQMYPTAPGATNVTDWMRQLSIISDARLDNGITFDGATRAGSSTNWYMACDPAQIDLIELAYLEGAAGIYTETRMGFDVDGIEIKVRQDVGAKPIDWRGFWQVPA